MPEWHKQLLTYIYISSTYYKKTIVLFYIVYIFTLQALPLPKGCGDPLLFFRQHHWYLFSFYL